MQALRKAGLGDANLAQLAEWHLQLQAAFERMANIKEYRRERYGPPCGHLTHTLPCHCTDAHRKQGSHAFTEPTLGQLLQHQSGL